MDDIDLNTLFSSKSDNWQTPDDLFRTLDKEFLFDLDAAASADNTKCLNYLTEEQNALRPETIWPSEHAIWLNPPYSLTAEFLARAHYEATVHQNNVVVLIPSRTDTKYWHEWVTKASEVRFLKGRVKFEQPGLLKSSAAPFPSAVVIYRTGPTCRPTTMFNWDWRA